MDRRELEHAFWNCDDFCGMSLTISQHTNKLVRLPWTYAPPGELLRLGYPKDAIEPASPAAEELMNQAKQLGIW